jgi:hypothetical protein
MSRLHLMHCPSYRLKDKWLSLIASQLLTRVLRYANGSAPFMDAYCKGLNGVQASWANKLYHGHCNLPLRIMDEMPGEFKWMK